MLPRTSTKLASQLPCDRLSPAHRCTRLSTAVPCAASEAPTTEPRRHRCNALPPDTEPTARPPHPTTSAVTEAVRVVPPAQVPYVIVRVPQATRSTAMPMHAAGLRRCNAWARLHASWQGQLRADSTSGQRVRYAVLAKRAARVTRAARKAGTGMHVA